MRYLLYTSTILIVLFLFSSCSDRLKNDLNPYGKALEEYPEDIVIPAEGGTVELVFESNFKIDLIIGCVGVDDYDGWFEPGTTTIADEKYYHKVSISITADSNTTGTERTDTLRVEYGHPSIIMPIYKNDIIGEYSIRQPALL